MRPKKVNNIVINEEEDGRQDTVHYLPALKNWSASTLWIIHSGLFSPGQEGHGGCRPETEKGN